MTAAAFPLTRAPTAIHRNIHFILLILRQIVFCGLARYENSNKEEETREKLLEHYTIPNMRCLDFTYDAAPCMLTIGNKVQNYFKKKASTPYDITNIMTSEIFCTRGRQQQIACQTGLTLDFLDMARISDHTQERDANLAGTVRKTDL